MRNAAFFFLCYPRFNPFTSCAVLNWPCPTLLFHSLPAAPICPPCIGLFSSYFRAPLLPPGSLRAISTSLPTTWFSSLTQQPQLSCSVAPNFAFSMSLSPSLPPSNSFLCSSLLGSSCRLLQFPSHSYPLLTHAGFLCSLPTMFSLSSVCQPGWILPQPTCFCLLPK